MKCAGFHNFWTKPRTFSSRDVSKVQKGHDHSRMTAHLAAWSKGWSLHPPSKLYIINLSREKIRIDFRNQQHSICFLFTFKRKFKYRQFCKISWIDVWCNENTVKFCYESIWYKATPKIAGNLMIRNVFFPIRLCCYNPSKTVFLYSSNNS